MKTHRYFIFMVRRTVLTQQQRHSSSNGIPIFFTILQFRQFRLLLNLLLLVKWPSRSRQTLEGSRQTLEGLLGFGYGYWSYPLRSLGSILPMVDFTISLFNCHSCHG